MIFILVGPSAVGKSTIIHKVLSEGDMFTPLVSHTTRDPREDEKPGRDYFFVSEDRFLEMKSRDLFVETTQYRGTYYGLNKTVVQETLSLDSHPIVAMDRHGLSRMEEEYGDQVVSFLITPPSLEALERRMVERYDEDLEKVQNRLDDVEEELEGRERFDYVLENDTLERAVEEFMEICREEVYG